MGNPHVIFFVENIDNFNIEKIGPLIENDKLFSEKCNVTLANLVNKNLVRVKVWERGAGLTKACGTAACAAAVAAYELKLVKKTVTVDFVQNTKENRGLYINIVPELENKILMEGPTSGPSKIQLKV